MAAFHRPLNLKAVRPRINRLTFQRWNLAQDAGDPDGKCDDAFEARLYIVQGSGAPGQRGNGPGLSGQEHAF
jgi:hypothetical protein